MKDIVFVFLTIMLLIWYSKPRFLFQSNGLLREFGTGYSRQNYEKKTLFNMTTIVIFIVVVLTTSRI